MSDLFHEDIPFPVLQRVFETMNKAHWHNFQILTKRSMELLKLAGDLIWTPNIWMGVTIESDRYLHRLRALHSVPAAVRFVSFEPLLSAIPADTDLREIDWVIVGGESGPGARPMNPEWVEGLLGICQRDKVAFFFKQWGGFHKNAGGRLLGGRTWNEMPTAKVERDPQKGWQLVSQDCKVEIPAMSLRPVNHQS